MWIKSLPGDKNVFSCVNLCCISYGHYAVDKLAEQLSVAKAYHFHSYQTPMSCSCCNAIAKRNSSVFMSPFYRVHKTKCTVWWSYLSVSVHIKVKLSLYLSEHNAMKAYWGSGGTAPHSLTSPLDGGEWSASHPGHFTPGKEPLVPTG
jgi:hypothetical protein